MRDGQATTHPIAGTRWRGATEEEDLLLEKELRTDEKERAEHVMLVDLGRNDLGRVCEPGTVKVHSFFSVERYSHVMHLVSTVTGTLRADRNAFDAVTACFPAGTLSGAPKPRAMEIIEELEPTRRGLYGGIVGYLDFAGDADTAIAIRTALVRDGVAYVQAGGGIVADSDPVAEDNECLNKARAVLSAVATAATMGRRGRAVVPAGAPAAGHGSADRPAGVSRATSPVPPPGSGPADGPGRGPSGPAPGPAGSPGRPRCGWCAPGWRGGGVALGGSVAVWFAVRPPGRPPVELTGAEVSRVPGAVALLALAGVAAVVATRGIAASRVGLLLARPGRRSPRSRCAGCSAIRSPPASAASGLPSCRPGSVEALRGSRSMPTAGSAARRAGAALLLAVGLFVLVSEPRLAHLGARYGAPARRRGRARPGPGRLAGAGRRPRSHRRPAPRRGGTILATAAGAALSSMVSPSRPRHLWSVTGGRSGPGSDSNREEAAAHGATAEAAFSSPSWRASGRTSRCARPRSTSARSSAGPPPRRRRWTCWPRCGPRASG